jgi:hypothetical protein
MCSSDILCECEYKQANSSQQMDYKVRSHDLGNLPRSYYYVKKVLQFIRLVINITVKERVYSIFKNKVHIILMQRDAWYKTRHMRGVSYAILMLQKSCSVGYLLPNLETFHSTTTEKSIHLLTHIAIHEVAWYVIKQKKMMQWNSCTTQPKQIFMVKPFFLQKHSPFSWNFVHGYKTTPHF